jgi:superfamily II DNA or RNA helicase
MFITSEILFKCTWQALERLTGRLLMYLKYDNVRLVGGTGDQGADIIATLNNRRWLFQAKNWRRSVGTEVVDEVIKGSTQFGALVPCIVSPRGFDNSVKERALTLHSTGIPLQLWDSSEIINKVKSLSTDLILNEKKLRAYQEQAVVNIVQAYINEYENNSLIVLATGLGKTFVAAEALRRINLIENKRILVLAHSNPLVYQLEKSFWPFLTPLQTTTVWNGIEKTEYELMSNSDFVFACIFSVEEYLSSYGMLPEFDIILVDECHHAGSVTYQKVLNYYGVGTKTGCFGIGITATPWRADNISISEFFGEPRIQIDMITGIKNGFLANIDYRMHTDNIDWEKIRSSDGKMYSPRQMNKTLFIDQWDDAVVNELKNIWIEQANPKALVFCGTIDHALIMRDKINSLGFCKAEAIFSSSSSVNESISNYQKNKILADFSDSLIQVICAVDIFNEGIDVPDVNIIVFQRVTHSRRIFIQQLGRGLRISEGKSSVIVLDFVSDVRRFAAGLQLKDKLAEGARLDIPNKVVFRRIGKEDDLVETFIRDWLNDVGTLDRIEETDEDLAVLKFPSHVIN